MLTMNVLPKGTQRGRMPLICLETPPKPVRSIGKQIDAIEVGDKIRERGGIERSFQVGDIQLRELEVGHHRSLTASRKLRAVS